MSHRVARDPNDPTAPVVRVSGGTARPDDRLRIACSGVVGADSGSVASAGFEMLRELLRRGHEIDFFSKRSYVYPEALVEHPGFRYHDCSQPRLDRSVASFSRQNIHWVALQVGNATYMRRIVRAMRHQHCARAYDAEFFLGQWAYGRIPQVPVVSWVQGAPGSDARSVARHRERIKALCGPREYVKLRVYASYRRSRLGRPPFRHTDISICGSRHSQSTLVTRFELPVGAVRALPYPIDLDEFAPSRVMPPSASAELLWVGRIVPRKRLDLFLDAGAQLIRAGIDARLTVVGGYPFARGYHALVERFPFPDRLTYIARLSRDQVCSRMQSASALVQPSEDEDFGSSVAEALACGTPVVVGPTNGTADYVGLGGERFGEYTAESVATAVGRLLARRKHNELDLRAQARQAAVKHFAVEGIVDRLEQILRAGRGAEVVRS